MNVYIYLIPLGYTVKAASQYDIVACVSSVVLRLNACQRLFVNTSRTTQCNVNANKRAGRLEFYFCVHDALHAMRPTNQITKRRHVTPRAIEALCFVMPQLFNNGCRETCRTCAFSPLQSNLSLDILGYLKRCSRSDRSISCRRMWYSRGLVNNWVHSHTWFDFPSSSMFLVKRRRSITVKNGVYRLTLLWVLQFTLGVRALCKRT